MKTTRTTKIIKLTLLTALFGALLTTASAQSWLTNGLVAYYPFNGNANDESGKGDHGIVYGATLASDRFGVPNRAYFFDPEYYTAVATAGTNLPLGTAQKTFSCWFRTTTPYLQHGYLWLIREVLVLSYAGYRVWGRSSVRRASHRFGARAS